MKDKRKKSDAPEIENTGGAENKIKDTTNITQPSDKYKYLIKNRQVRKHSRRHKIVMILTIFLAATVVLGGAAYAMLSFLEFNNFKILIDKEGMNILSLSNSEDFATPSEVISLGGPKYLDNTSLLYIDYLLPDIQEANGSFSHAPNANYIAATFFLKNVSGEDQTYSEAVELKDITKGIDEAIRIMIIRDGEITVYAKANADGQPEEVVPGQYYKGIGQQTIHQEEVMMTQPFKSENLALLNNGVTLKANEQKKYSILIWLEGNDPECIDPILGGTLKLEMKFTKI